MAVPTPGIDCNNGIALLTNPPATFKAPLATFDTADLAFLNNFLNIFHFQSW
jgi:hypothetical protein